MGRRGIEMPCDCKPAAFYRPIYLLQFIKFNYRPGETWLPVKNLLWLGVPNLGHLATPDLGSYHECERSGRIPGDRISYNCWNCRLRVPTSKANFAFPVTFPCKLASTRLFAAAIRLAKQLQRIDYSCGSLEPRVLSRFTALVNIVQPNTIAESRVKAKDVAVGRQSWQRLESANTIGGFRSRRV